MSIVINILMILSSIVLIVSVLMQDSDSDGMSALTGGSSETFFGRNKNTSLQGKLANITKISAAVFVLLAIIAMFVNR